MLLSCNAVKKVIKCHVSGEIRAHESVQKDEPTFKTLHAKHLNLIQTILRKDCKTSAREIRRILSSEGTNVGLTTVRKAIKAAGFTAAKNLSKRRTKSTV